MEDDILCTGRWARCQRGRYHRRGLYIVGTASLQLDIDVDYRLVDGSGDRGNLGSRASQVEVLSGSVATVAKCRCVLRRPLNLNHLMEMAKMLEMVALCCSSLVKLNAEALHLQ